MMTLRTPEEAIAFAKSLSARDVYVGVGMCLKVTREHYNANSLWPDAATAWRNTKHKHKTSNANNIPRGAPVFWTGGSKGFGHIAISCGGGRCWTTDFHRSGYVDIASISNITNSWGQKLVGWSNDLNGQLVFPGVNPPAQHQGAHSNEEVKAAIKKLRSAASSAAKKGNDARAAALRTYADNLRKRFLSD